MHKDKRIMNWQPFMNKVYNATSVIYPAFLACVEGRKKKCDDCNDAVYG